ncbi:cytochrome c biogenesis CcdA family protein [Lentzea flaviverrucosa]|uniref:Cytochrome c biogenesis protein CcdA n=1 Tax=Lentzea flaviverrucosa TaxID=200379 RepID=A0A1H9EPP4_9PSEU|nr:cytochrome c biogenesis protein CcdA [Lentzea flaviverrucosa]RDI35428.1 cytochrome c biogenesis protein CcdA [Lentzea flaviverrucosa]SEQ27619.1 Cytochrome c biogenesis protein CcdA [Lentzea flaviverrucosa]
MTDLLVLAFAAGVVTPVNPCGFALLPGYLAAAATRDSTSGPTQRLLAALRGGLALTTGFTGTFVIAALAVALGLRPLLSWTPWLVVGLAILITLAGIALLAGVRLPSLMPARISTGTAQHPRRMIVFGAVYAVASLSCTLPILVALTAQSLAVTHLPGLLAVLAGYAAGATTVLLAIAVTTTLAAGLLTRLGRRVLPHATRVAGAILTATGIYLLLFWAPTLTGEGRPDDRGWTSTTAAAADWIATHPETAVIALAILAPLVTLAFRRARRDPDVGRSAGSADERTSPGKEQ